MATFVKEKNGTWRVVFVYQDWTGDRKRTTKRGFSTKREVWLKQTILICRFVLLLMPILKTWRIVLN